MSRWTRAMSPTALFISILALVVATSAGTAYAAVKIGTKQLKNGAVTSAKIRDSAVSSVDVRDGGVTGADLADAGITGIDVADASLGVADISGTAQNALRGARAYATVDQSPSGSSNPALVAARTRGFTAITEGVDGRYCLTVDPALGIDLTKATVVVGLDRQSTLTSDPSVMWDSGSDCPAGQIQVETYSANLLNDGVGFTVAIQ